MNLARLRWALFRRCQVDPVSSAKLASLRSQRASTRCFLVLAHFKNTRRVHHHTTAPYAGQLAPDLRPAGVWHARRFATGTSWDFPRSGRSRSRWKLRRRSGVSICLRGWIASRFGQPVSDGKRAWRHRTKARLEPEPPDSCSRQRARIPRRRSQARRRIRGHPRGWTFWSGSLHRGAHEWQAGQ